MLAHTVELKERVLLFAVPTNHVGSGFAMTRDKMA